MFRVPRTTAEALKHEQGTKPCQAHVSRPVPQRYSFFTQSPRRSARKVRGEFISIAKILKNLKEILTS